MSILQAYLLAADVCYFSIVTAIIRDLDHTRPHTRSTYVIAGMCILAMTIIMAGAIVYRNVMQGALP